MDSYQAPSYWDEAKQSAIDLVTEAVQSSFGKETEVDQKALFSAITRSSKFEHGELALPCFVFAKTLKGNPAVTAHKIGLAVSQILAKNQKFNQNFAKVEVTGPYINFFLSVQFLAKVIFSTQDGAYTKPLSQQGKQRVMIEYSQPNTHKAFHVGHMRNAALGDSLVRLYEQMGHPVVAANYFGDEGAHIAKCLWQVSREAKEKKIDVNKLLDAVPVKERGEWLGARYSSAVEALSLDTLTALPYLGVVAAKVVSKEKHPSAEAPANWHVVKVEHVNGAVSQVVCGGSDYKEGDIVGYIPVGNKFGAKTVAVMDKGGVESHGIIVALRELEIDEPKLKKIYDFIAEAEKAKAAAEGKDNKGKDKGGKQDKGGKGGKGGKDQKEQPKQEEPKPEQKQEQKPEQKQDKQQQPKQDKQQQPKQDKQQQPKQDKQQQQPKQDNKGGKQDNKGGKQDNKQQGGKQEKQGKQDNKDNKQGGGKDKKAEKEKQKQADNKIFVLPATFPVGVELTEFGRLPDLPFAHSVSKEITDRENQVRDFLKEMESPKPSATKDLWSKTRQWSLDEFKRIYAWLGARFDHDFFESEVGEESIEMVKEFYKKGVLVNSDGAIGADLKAFGLGFCMLLKSNGSGLYATKDLALARRKFEKFKIDKSIYVVDAAQSLHFQQVFKTLELFGYEKAKHCIHLPYGLVILASGKMSSRKGTVILFSQLTDLLNKQITADYLGKYKQEKPKENPKENKQDNNKKQDNKQDNKKQDSKDKKDNKGKEKEKEKVEAKKEEAVVAVADEKESNKELWSDEEIEEALRKISVATIKYGMLNHDTAKDIVFELENWTAATGNTGPYMLYAYARIKSILREVLPAKEAKVDPALLSTERHVLSMMWDMWSVIESCTKKNNPSGLCDYLFNLSKEFSSWYEKNHVKKAGNIHLQATRLAFISSLSKVLNLGLSLLGIETLERM